MMRYRGDRLTFTGLEADDYTTYFFNVFNSFVLFRWSQIILCLRVLVPMALISWYLTQDHPNILRWTNPAVRVSAIEFFLFFFIHIT